MVEDSMDPRKQRHSQLLFDHCLLLLRRLTDRQAETGLCASYLSYTDLVNPSSR